MSRTHNLKLITICVIAIVLCTVSFITVGARRTELSFTENSGLSIKDDLYMMGLPEKTKAAEVMNRVSNPTDVYLKNNSGVICGNSDVVGTGYDLSVIQHNVSNKTVEAVILGDTNGDGKVQTNDYIRIKNAFYGRLELEGAFFEAADVNQDGKLGTMDYIRIKKYFSNVYDLYTDLPEVSPSSAAEATANPYSLGNSVEYANQVKNQVDNYFIYDGSVRKSIVMENNTMQLTHGLVGDGEKQIQEFNNKNGGVYFTDSFVPYFQVAGGDVSYFNNGNDATTNDGTPVLRNGYYYYETHLRDIDFNAYGAVRMDLTYNTLADSLRVNHRLIADSASTKTFTLGNELKIDKKTVSSLEIADKNGIHNSIDNIDAASVEYVAFDIKNAGIAGLIYAADCDCDSVTVTLEYGMYVIRSSRQINGFSQGDTFNMAIRLYNDATHSFAGVREAAYIERNPVAVTVNSTSIVNSYNEVFYNSKTGMYQLSADIPTFWNYSDTNANKYSEFNITVENDGHERPVYIHVNTSAGGLATGLVRNGDGAVVAIPAEVCKNFSGDDPAYEPDIAYGDIIFPLYLEGNESASCIPTCLWQNWGEAPLTQISSIQYYFMYLHMSTKSSETTCLTPSGAGGKGGNIVADFRGCSGDIWATQPQYNHAGNFFFTSENNIRWNSELRDVKIISSGPAYGKIDLSYIADSGNYEYKLTHMEFPSTDETRNYYSLEITFLKDTYYNNTKSKFCLLTYYTTMGTYSNMAYLDSDGNVQQSAVSSGAYVLNKEGSFFTFYTNSSTDTENVGIIVKDYQLIMSGEKVDTELSMRVYNDSSAALVLNEGKMTFKKGDTIKVNFILLPYGNPQQTDFDNVLNVYNDSVVNALTAKVSKGTLVEDPFMPMVYAENNEAEFTVSGGVNYVAVRVDGFSSDAKPAIQEYVAGQWIDYDYSVKDYDGYYIHYNEDNTYGFSFVVDMGTDGAERTFRVVQG